MSPVKRTSEEDKWKKVLKQRDHVRLGFGADNSNLGKSVEERDRIPEKACARCIHFLAVIRSTLGNGDCDLLRFGSDVSSDPPVYVLEGPMPMSTSFKMDASRCKYYEKRDFIDTDATECADPTYSRRMRQMKE